MRFVIQDEPIDRKSNDQPAAAPPQHKKCVLALMHALRHKRIAGCVRVAL